MLSAFLFLRKKVRKCTTKLLCYFLDYRKLIYGNFKLEVQRTKIKIRRQTVKVVPLGQQIMFLVYYLTRNMTYNFSLVKIQLLNRIDTGQKDNLRPNGFIEGAFLDHFLNIQLPLPSSFK